MRRFFVDDITAGSKEVRIVGDEFGHLKRVLRLKKGDRVSVFNGKGLELAGSVSSIGRDSALVEIRGRVVKNRESPLRVVLLQGLVKKDKPELIIEKATELGVAGILFYPAARTVNAFDPGKAGSKLVRWRKVAVGAAKQCNRSIVPEIRYSPGLPEAIKTAMEAAEAAPNSGLRLLALEPANDVALESGGGGGGLKAALKHGIPEDGVTVLVGPEGGFTDDESDFAKKAGFLPVGLGPRTLRAETAAVALLAILFYELGDMGQ
jgi:16S rRNA (uracil1498-N3)-methyltransferase